MSEEKKKTPKTISRREFLKDAGIVVGGTAVGSAFFLSACGKEVEVTKTVTTTAPGTTSTITKTAPGTTSTVTTTAGGTTQTVTKYICPACNQEFSSLDALKAHYDSQHGAQTAVCNVIKLDVNGREYEFQVKLNETLRDTLREKAGLTSIKDMCNGYGACGTCTVIMDGRPVLSCMTLTIECDGSKIETAEGIAASKHPLIDTYIENNCMQCGYCTPGFLCTSKALLDRKANPTTEEVKQALAGNLCRCATYQQHPIAVLAASSALKGGK